MNAIFQRCNTGVEEETVSASLTDESNELLDWESLEKEA
jgi:hypothetical protein